MIISIDVAKVFDGIQHSFMIKKKIQKKWVKRQCTSKYKGHI